MLCFHPGPPESPRAVGDLDEMQQDFQYPVHQCRGSWVAFRSAHCRRGARPRPASTGAAQAAMAACLPWELPRGDEGGRWLWRTMGGVGKGLPLLQGEPLTLGWISEEHQPGVLLDGCCGLVWLKGLRPHH